MTLASFCLCIFPDPTSNPRHLVEGISLIHPAPQLTLSTLCPLTHLLTPRLCHLPRVSLKQKKHVECAELLLGSGAELNGFVARLLDDMANLKAMLQAISIGGL